MRKMLFKVLLHKLGEALLDVWLDGVHNVFLSMHGSHNRGISVGDRSEGQLCKLILEPNHGRYVILGPSSNGKDRTEHQNECGEAQEAIKSELPLPLASGRRMQIHGRSWIPI